MIMLRQRIYTYGTILLFIASTITQARIVNIPYEKIDLEEFQIEPVGFDTKIHDAQGIIRARIANKKNVWQQKKPWTFIVYMSADNDLRGFAARNIKQMAAIGSNQYINIVVQLDIRIAGERKITRRYYIEQGRILHVNANDPDSQQMDSGAPETLISCCTWAINNYPAENYGLVFWNHGTGICDPERGRIINATELFSFNPISNKLELDRSIGFFDFVNAINDEEERRGICWDDSTGNYLTNQALEYALGIIQRDCLGGGKFGIVAFDACLMAMLEVGNIMRKFAHVMIGSQEVELGTGWNYTHALSPFQEQALDINGFAQHIVNAYQQTYQHITSDYTQSAMDLSTLEQLEHNTHIVAQLFIDCLKQQKNGSVKRAIKASRDKLVCTHFDEPSYIDQHHFYSNVLANLRYFELNSPQATAQKIAQLSNALQEGCRLIQNIAFANKVGSNLSQAKGISIYFPERKIHPSYRKTTFALHNDWILFLTHYLLA